MPALRRLSTTLGTVLALTGAARAAAAGLTEADSPLPESAHEGWVAGRRWLDAASIGPDASHPIHGCHGVSVVLRLQGRVIGRGTDTGEASADLARAVRRAIHDAADDPLVRFLEGRSPHSWGAQACLELELAGAPEVIPGAGIEAISGRISPGLDAVAMRRGQEFAWSFPSQEHTNASAADALRTLSRLAGELQVGSGDRPAQDAAESIAVYRAGTIRMAQNKPDAAPFLAPRGHAEIEAGDLSHHERLAFASQIAAWLAGMLPPTNLAGNEQALAGIGLPEGYLPGIDRRDGVAAPPAEQALAAFALARFANLAGVPAADGASAREAALRILAALGQVDEIEREPWDNIFAAALTVRTAAELGAAPLPAAAALAVSRASESLAAKLAESARTRGSIIERAVVLAAAASTVNQPAPGVPRQKLEQALDQLWSECEVAQLPSCLDWLVDAERSLGRNSALAAQRAQEARLRLSMAQLGAASDIEPLPPDLHGAFGLSGTDRIACAQSSRPGTGLASMLSSRHFTPESERQAAAQIQQRLLRFLRQLQMDERSCYWAANPRSAAGGLCAAPWSPRMSVAANAQALWCVCESDAALEASQEEPPRGASRTES